MSDNPDPTPAYEVLRRISDFESDEIISVEPLAGGLSNQNFACTLSSGRYVVRIVDPAAGLSRNRVAERAALERVSQIGVGPQLIAAFPEGHIVTRFIEGRSFSNDEIFEPAILTRLVRALATVHGATPIDHAYSHYRAIESGLAGLGETHGRFPALGEHLEVLGRIERSRLAALEGRLALGHNDPFFPNFIDDGSIRIIDWEFAGMADPWYDLAAVLYPWDGRGMDTVLDAYDGPLSTTGDRPTLLSMMYVGAFWNAVWAAGQIETSPIEHDFEESLEQFISSMVRLRAEL